MSTRVGADRLFRALDGSRLSVAGVDWRVQVFGVFDEPRRRWMQIGLEGGHRTVLTLRLKHTQGPDRVLRQIRRWLHDPVSDSNVLQRVA